MRKVIPPLERDFKLFGLIQIILIDIDPINLMEIRRVFSNCRQLEELYFTTEDLIIPDGDYHILSIYKKWKSTIMIYY